MLRNTFIALAVAWSTTGVASAQVAMLTQASGEVRLAAKDGVRPAVPFLKVDDGSVLQLRGNARVQMVYLATGRQEVWQGEGRVDIGAQGGRSASLTPLTSQVPAVILKQLAKTPAVGEHGKTGMVMLRSLDDLDAADTLEKDYAAFRRTAAADDTTPEVFLLSGLLDLQDYDRAKTVLADLEARQATQPVYAAVIAHFRPLVEEAAAAKR